MVVITGGADAKLIYTPEDPVESMTATLYDASGAEVEIVGTPSVADGVWTLELDATESLPLIGQVCTVIWGERDVEHLYVSDTTAQVTVHTIATAGDLELFGYPVTAARFLMRASERVRAYAGQQVTKGQSTVTLRFPYLLPQRPVVSVEEVRIGQSAATYTLEGQRILLDKTTEPVTVTYTHGYDTPPAELIELVCGIAHRMGATPHSLTSGIQLESADGEQVSYGSDAFGGVAELTSAEKRVLDRIFPHTRSVPRVAVTM